MMTELYRLTGRLGLGIGLGPSSLSLSLSLSLTLTLTRAKQSRAVAHVLRWCGHNPSGAKLLVFAHHAEMMDALQDRVRIGLGIW